MLTRLRNISQAFTKLLKPIQMASIPKSPNPSSPGSPRAIKRQKLDHAAEDSGEVKQSTATVTEAELAEREMALPFEFEKKYTHELDYRNKLVLAPMVRTGSRELFELGDGDKQ